MGANLSTMRSAIELYRVQHNNTYPSKAPTGTAPTTCSGTKGSVADNDKATMIAQLTTYSNANGHTCTIGSADYPYGPYLRAIPAEPITNDNTITVVTDPETSKPGTATTGWRFVNTIGKFQVNSSNNARDGKTPLSDK